MRPEPSQARGAGGLCSSAGVSSSLKTRSLAAIAACRMLYFSLRSWMGRKKRWEYWIKATSTPIVTALRSTPNPPSQITRAMATELSNSIAG